MKTAILIVGAVFGCVMGASMGACSSSSTGGTGAGTTTSSSTTGASSSSTGSATTSSSSSSSGSAGGAGGGTSSSSTSGSSSSGECGTVSKLHPPKADAGPGTIFCPFSATTDGGPEEYCTPETQHCCETPEGNATASGCQPSTTACMTGTGFTDWQCQDPVTDCPAASPVCCAPGATLELGTPVGTCGNYASKMTHSTCTTAAACPASGNIILCTSDSECTAPAVCTAFEKAGGQVGGCM